MKFTYVGVAARKTLELSTGNLLVMEKGVSVDVPEALAQKLLTTPGYRCDDKEVVAEAKADAKAAEAEVKAAEKAADAAEKAEAKAERAEVKAAEKSTHK